MVISSRNYITVQTILIAVLFFYLIRYGLLTVQRVIQMDNKLELRTTQRKQLSFLSNGIELMNEDQSKTQRCLSKMTRDNCKTCLHGWYGKDCGIPPHPKSVIISERKYPRLIVQITIVNHEIDLLRLKIQNSLPFTNEFIVIEGDKTFALAPKPYYVQQYFSELSTLIKLRLHHIHIKTKNQKSWEVQNEMRMSKTSIHHLFPDISVNATVIFTDLDEIIRPEVIYFLKYYDSEPPPRGVKWDTYLYGFFYHDSHIIRPSSFGNVQQTPESIRNQPSTWLIPKGGWHCAWCFTIEGMQQKLKASPFVDFPRIADNPEFLKPSVLYNHVLKGKWFLGTKYIRRKNPTDIPEKTPIYMKSYDWWLKHAQSFDESDNTTVPTIS